MTKCYVDRRVPTTTTMRGRRGPVRQHDGVDQHRATPRPAAERLAERVNAAAYGTVLVLVALSAIEVADIAEGHSAELVLGVGAATWVAHLFAELLAEHVRHGEPVAWAEVRRASLDGSPILAATVLPAGLLFLARIDVLGDETARNLAILLAVVQLSLIGGVVARSTPGSPTPAWVFAICTALAGLGVVALKILLGH
ncbi:MAG: hypothetical protein ACJ739_04790 [Acidimicrobiales bacterium]